MKYKQILIITTTLLLSIQSKSYCQNFDTINPLPAYSDTLYDIQITYRLPDNYDISNFNSDSLQSSERKIPKVRTIFKEGKIYQYKATYSSSDNKILSNTFINLKTTGQRWDQQPEIQDLIHYEFPNYKADSITLSNHNINKEIQYWADSDATGIVENFERVWMHPIRINQYKFTEVAPFPQVYFPMKKGNKWDDKVTINENWGEWDGQTVTSKYKITDRSTFQLNNLDINCWVIKSVSKCASGKSKLTTYFNEEYGFVKMEYQNYEKEKLVFELINMEVE